jgi:hypothetical protein
MKTISLRVVSSLVLLLGLSVRGEIKVVTDHNANDSASAAFKFKKVPSPGRKNSAMGKTLTIVDGERDGNGGDVDKLNDGKLPQEGDQPGENFFFNAGTPGGRLALDLEKVIEIKEINTYSWHPATRGPQVYKLYAADGTAENFKPAPKGSDPEKSGWKLIATVDTRDKSGDNGGQYGASISDSEGSIGKFRYLLFDVSRTEAEDEFGNTFYSEIEVIDKNATSAAGSTTSEGGEGIKEKVEIDGGKYTVLIDTTAAPDLTDWATNKVIPMVKEWYPKLVAMFPSEGYQAPKEFSIAFIDGRRGVAATGGTRITCSGGWFRSNLEGEALGAVFHEVIHVVQQYGAARRANPDAPRGARPPGWLTEGIPDYVRWYKFEPQLHGADITRRNFSRAKYDASYRITANFLNWTSEKYDKDLATKLNAAIREGRYSENLWKDYTGHSVQELDAEWRKELETKLGLEPTPKQAQPSASRSEGLPLWLERLESPNAVAPGLEKEEPKRVG